MEIILAAGAAVLGAIFGSFINALSFRWGTGVSISTGRSRCMRCGHALHAADLVPVFSYLFLRGRCRYCGSRISWQYPAVEMAGAALSIAIYLTHPDPAYYTFWLAAWMLLLFLVVYDLRHKIIPWTPGLVLALLALGYAYMHFAAAYDLVAGPVLALPLFLLWLLSRGKWMGLGDSLVEISLGWLLGLTAGLTAFMLAFWIGAMVGILLMLLGGRVTMRSEVPLAPFLVLGAAAAYFLHADFFATLPLLFSLH